MRRFHLGVFFLCISVVGAGRQTVLHYGRWCHTVCRSAAVGGVSPDQPRHLACLSQTPLHSHCTLNLELWPLPPKLGPNWPSTSFWTIKVLMAVDVRTFHSVYIIYISYTNHLEHTLGLHRCLISVIETKTLFVLFVYKLFVFIILLSGKCTSMWECSCCSFLQQ